MYDFDRTFDRHNTEVIKWDRLEKDFGRKDLIPFGIADMDFETLPEITRAMTERAKHPTYGYTLSLIHIYLLKSRPNSMKRALFMFSSRFY